MEPKELEMPQDFMHLITEDGDEIECDILRAFTLDGKDYVVLLPVPETEEEEEEAEALIYRYTEDEEGSPILELPESKEDYEAAIAAFYQLLDSEPEFEYDEEAPLEE